jgi:hypothetical protein
MPQHQHPHHTHTHSHSPPRPWKSAFQYPRQLFPSMLERQRGRDRSDVSSLLRVGCDGLRGTWRFCVGRKSRATVGPALCLGSMCCSICSSISLLRSIVPSSSKFVRTVQFFLMAEIHHTRAVINPNPEACMWNEFGLFSFRFLR